MELSYGFKYFVKIKRATLQHIFQQLQHFQRSKIRTNEEIKWKFVGQNLWLYGLYKGLSKLDKEGTDNTA